MEGSNDNEGALSQGVLRSLWLQALRELDEKLVTRGEPVGLWWFEAPRETHVGRETERAPCAADEVHDLLWIKRRVFP